MNNNEQKLKIGVLGCGKMGQQHMQAIKLQGSAEIVAVADPMPDKAKLNSILPGSTKIYSDSDELIKNETLDILHIVTPPSTHAGLAELALNQGMNIYVEKPFTLNVSDAREIVSLANKNSLKICAGHQALFEHASINARKKLSEIGEVVHVESYFSFHQARRNLSPVEQLIDILPHPVYLLVHFLGLSADTENDNDAKLISLEVRSDGDVRALIKMHGVTAVLVVTLRGRPVEPYLRIVGTNGSLHVDYIHGAIAKLAGPGSSGVSVVLNPYIRSMQIIAGTTKGLVSRALRKQKSYVGLPELIDAFYTSVINNSAPPVSTSSIVETVKICEAIGDKLNESDAESEKIAKAKLSELEQGLPPADTEKGGVLITGGTGFLGKETALMLRRGGWPVRVLSRNLPRTSARVPGVEYIVADLGESLSEEAFSGIETVVHCAAETAGGKEEHERNTIRATQYVIDASAKSGVRRFIHISSIAVIKTSREMGRPLDETVPLDTGNPDRGTYVWAKAESERLAVELCKKHSMNIRILRPGPLVDFKAFKAPGRLGKEVGPLYVAVGGKGCRLSVCDVHTAAKVLFYYVNNFDAAPPVLNLVESEMPTRKELAERLKKVRTDLKVFWMPMFLLKILSPPLKLLQKVLLPGKKPIDLADVFATEIYRNDLAVEIIRRTSN